jgi:Leucine-rich repeat (LRR) protein
MGNNNVANRKWLMHSKHNLHNRTKIDLSYKNITSIDQQTFQGLNQLSIIKLSDNRIELLNPVFNGLINLTEIYLQFNEIKELNPKVFNGLNRLKILNLHDNKLETLHSEIFQGKCYFRLRAYVVIIYVFKIRSV